jgi:hypothetical protein
MLFARSRLSGLIELLIRLFASDFELTNNGISNLSYAFISISTLAIPEIALGLLDTSLCCAEQKQKAHGPFHMDRDLTCQSRFDTERMGWPKEGHQAGLFRRQLPIHFVIDDLSLFMGRIAVYPETLRSSGLIIFPPAFGVLC